MIRHTILGQGRWEFLVSLILLDTGLVKKNVLKIGDMI